MRPVSRLSRRLRAAVRLERERPWRRRLRRWAPAVALVLLVPPGVLAAARAGLPERLSLALRGSFEQTSRALGLVVREVTVEGRVRTEPEALVKLLESRVGVPILSVELNELRKQLEALPWVRTAAVRRQLPDTLHAVLEEHRPLALWRERDGARVKLVDEEGEIVPVSDLRAFTGLPLLAGKGAPRAAKELFALLAQTPEIARRVTAASYVGERRWNLYLDGRIEVRLPEADPAAALARLAAEERAHGLLARAIDVVDLRTPEWIVVRTVDAATRRVPQPQGGRGA
ncbi:MAG: FtsQ-type POTRA domain-containing protein [Geminicoccaceae bacterium]|nr:FtsQ-type POTRA domain-containing protein [Geminicoccaceae bacterium]